jgi:tetratricopeptide (TPR) repeat protein
VNARALALCAALVAFDDDLYRVTGSGDAILVSADRSAVPADQALELLARAVGWQIRFQSGRLRDDLAKTPLDLAFSEHGARTLARLLAVAGGADVMFNDRTVDGQPVTELIVVPPPGTDTDTGRQRLRRQAIDWYRTFLHEDLRATPLSSESHRVRMQMAQLLKDQGALRESARIFLEVYKDDPTKEHVPQALLRMAQCHLELGPEAWPDAERWARELSHLPPSLPETAQGTVLLGRLLNLQGRQAECVRTLPTMYLPLAGTPEIVELYLLVGEAWLDLDEPAEALATSRTIDTGHGFRELQKSQWLRYLFVRGHALQRLGRSAEATEALELLVGTGADDELRGKALIVLGLAYLDQRSYLDARAAALHARAYKPRLDRRFAAEASKLLAKTALEIGDKDRAFEDLEIEVRKNVEPELALYLVRAFVQEGRFQKAIAIADLLADQDNDAGDVARLERIEALWLQARATGNQRSFPQRAAEQVVEIRDPDRQRRVAELVGRAYELSGEVERAADAYRGLLR